MSFIHEISLKCVYGLNNLTCIYSSPEHEMLRVIYCDCDVSVVRCAASFVNFLPCINYTRSISSPILMKLGQNVCLDKISDDYKIESCRVKN